LLDAEEFPLSSYQHFNQNLTSAKLRRTYLIGGADVGLQDEV